jgi:serine/threonine-protein kinase
MIQLRTLGVLDLRESNGVAAESILVQPKRFALLTYLALTNSGGFRRRDTVVGLFWPELDQEHARNALRQALWFLRRTLGERVITSRGAEELGVDPAVLWCDATEFEQACTSGRPAEALELYRGDFLEGFFLSEVSPDLETWVEDQRVRLRRQAADAAWALAEERAAAADRVKAAEWARRAAQYTPTDEVAARRLIQMLDRLGDRAGAVQVYEAFAARLSQELELSPDPETTSLVVSVRSRASPASERDTPHSLGYSAEVLPPLHSPLPSAPASHLLSRRLARVVGLCAALGFAAASAIAWWPRAAPRVDPDLVVVPPFEVSASDSALGYLREGMMDLLAAELTGEPGPRAVDPRRVLHTYRESGGGDNLTREEVFDLARRLGAARVLEGGVLGTPDHLILAASLLEVDGDRDEVRARVEGPADSIAAMLDRLTAQLLAGEAGEPERRLGEMTSLPAVRAYLSGQAAVRDGRLWEAVRDFERALEVDSTFVLAALGLSVVAAQIAGPDPDRANRLAWAGRDRLSPADRALLVAQVGPRYPALPTRAELLHAAELAVELAPERPEGWYALGEAVFHDGGLLGLQDTRPRAADLIGRAFVLDSARGTRRPFVEPLTHLMEISLANGDTAGARLWAGRVLADSSREETDFTRWRFALGMGDSTALAGVRARLDRLDEGTLTAIIDAGQSLGRAMADAERAGLQLESRYGTDKQRGIHVWTLHTLMLNLGRPSRGAGLTERLPSPDRWIPHLRPLVQITDRLFWEGDSATAETAVRQLLTFAQRPVPRDIEERAVRANDLCALGLWHLNAGDLVSADRALSQFEVVSVADSFSLAAGNKEVCAAMLEASLAAARGLPTTRALVAGLDSILLTGPSTVWGLEATIVSGRLHSAVGDHAGALRAFRRWTDNGWQTFYLSTFLREQGREAALIGDTATAIRAYRHYLVLRSAPEPGLREEVARVRDELRELEEGYEVMAR